MMKTYDGKRKEREIINNWEISGNIEHIVSSDEICRLCLTRPESLKPIFKQKEGVPLPVRIMTCLQLEVVEGDGLPEVICNPCYFQVEKFYVFRKKCENADIKLRKYLKKATVNTNETINEDEDNSLKSERDIVGSSVTFIIPEEGEIDGEEIIDLETTEGTNITLPKEVQEDSRQQCTLKREILDEEYKDDERGVNESLESEIISESVTQMEISNEAGSSDENINVRVLSTAPGESTHVEVTTEDGSVLVMELTAEDEGASNEVEVDENGEFCVMKCPHCPKAFARYFQLRRHVSIHDQKKGYTCEFCEKWFPSRSSLKKHERSHTGEKPFQCGICKKCFTQKEILYRHLFTHSDKKPFNCATCGKGFTQKDALRTHAMTHMSPRPALRVHRCPLCPKLFCHPSGLSRHLLIHAGRTYMCGTCQKTFNDKSTMRKHQKMTMHRDEP